MYARAHRISLTRLQTQAVRCPGTQTKLRPNATIECYPTFSSSKEEKLFKKQYTADSPSTNGTVTADGNQTLPSFFQWQLAEALHERSFAGGEATYPGNGFVIDLMNMCDLVSVYPDLVEKRWIDVKTRVVFIDFAFYNPNMSASPARSQPHPLQQSLHRYTTPLRVPTERYRRSIRVLPHVEFGPSSGRAADRSNPDADSTQWTTRRV